MRKLFNLTENGYIHNINNEIENIENVEIELFDGSYIILPSNFNILTDNNGDLKYKNIMDISLNDYVVCSYNNNSFSDISEIENEKAYLIGLLYAANGTDGFKNDLLISDEIYNRLGDFLYRHGTFNQSEKRYFFKENFIQEYLLNDGVCNVILNSCESIQKSFIRGFFDTYTYINENLIVKSEYNINVLHDISIMLKNIGILSEIYDNTLILKGKNIFNYYTKVGFYNIKYENKFLEIKLNENDFENHYKDNESLYREKVISVKKNNDLIKILKENEVIINGFICKKDLES